MAGSTNRTDATERCPVCGYMAGVEASLETQWETLIWSYDICPCCGTEFGLDVVGSSLEDVKQSAQRRRAKWISEGHTWFSEHEGPPKGWDWRAQLRTIGVDVGEDSNEA